MVRILVADRHEIVRVGVRQIILEAMPNWEVIAEAADGLEAIAKAIETRPDVAVLDYSLPLCNGLEVTRQIRKAVPGIEVLVFSMQDSETLIEGVLTAGARGYVMKSDKKRTLIEAVKALAMHKPFFTDKITESLLSATLTKKNGAGSSLTNRERELVQLIAEGYSNKQAAKFLDISLKTIETHRSNVMSKLNLASAAALVRYAVRNNLIAA